MTLMNISDFQKLIWDFYAQNKRSMPWRESTDPYWILVSEIMLQQTQVSRVTPKFQDFIAAFPSIEELASASLQDVLLAWSGLGYNRRARYLWLAAQQINTEHGGHVPNNPAMLEKLPGIGPNTAGAILAYGFNQPVVFIETNIRSVYLHYFFPDKSAVDDKELIPLIQQSLSIENPREWYWALMDHGAYIKSVNANPSRFSKHYARQSTFEGSRRQLRGRILKQLTNGSMPKTQLVKLLEDERTESVLTELHKEKLINIKNGIVKI